MSAGLTGYLIGYLLVSLCTQIWAPCHFVCPNDNVQNFKCNPWVKLCWFCALPTAKVIWGSGPWLKVSFHRLEKLNIKPATLVHKVSGLSTRPQQSS